MASLAMPSINIAMTAFRDTAASPTPQNSSVDTIICTPSGAATPARLYHPTTPHSSFKAETSKLSNRKLPLHPDTSPTPAKSFISNYSSSSPPNYTPSSSIKLPRQSVPSVPRLTPFTPQSTTSFAATPFSNATPSSTGRFGGNIPLSYADVRTPGAASYSLSNAETPTPRKDPGASNTPSSAGMASFFASRSAHVTSPIFRPPASKLDCLDLGTPDVHANPLAETPDEEAEVPRGIQCENIADIPFSLEYGFEESLDVKLSCKANRVPLPYQIRICTTHTAGNIRPLSAKLECDLDLSPSMLLKMISALSYFQPVGNEHDSRLSNSTDPDEHVEEEAVLTFWAAPDTFIQHGSVTLLLTVLADDGNVHDTSIELHISGTEPLISVESGCHAPERDGQEISINFGPNNTKEEPVTIWNDSLEDAPILLNIVMQDPAGGAFSIGEVPHQVEECIPVKLLSGESFTFFTRFEVFPDLTLQRRYYGCVIIRIASIVPSKGFLDQDRELFQFYDHVINLEALRAGDENVYALPSIGHSQQSACESDEDQSCEGFEECNPFNNDHPEGGCLVYSPGLINHDTENLEDDPIPNDSSEGLTSKYEQNREDDQSSSEEDMAPSAKLSRFSLHVKSENLEEIPEGIEKRPFLLCQYALDKAPKWVQNGNVGDLEQEEPFMDQDVEAKRDDIPDQEVDQDVLKTNTITGSCDEKEHISLYKTLSSRNSQSGLSSSYDPKEQILEDSSTSASVEAISPEISSSVRDNGAYHNSNIIPSNGSSSKGSESVQTSEGKVMDQNSLSTPFRKHRTSNGVNYDNAAASAIRHASADVRNTFYENVDDDQRDITQGSSIAKLEYSKVRQEYVNFDKKKILLPEMSKGTEAQGRSHGEDIPRSNFSRNSINTGGKPHVDFDSVVLPLSSNIHNQQNSQRKSSEVMDKRRRASMKPYNLLLQHEKSFSPLKGRHGSISRSESLPSRHDSKSSLRPSTEEEFSSDILTYRQTLDSSLGTKEFGRTEEKKDRQFSVSSKETYASDKSQYVGGFRMLSNALSLKSIKPKLKMPRRIRKEGIMISSKSRSVEFPLLNPTKLKLEVRLDIKQVPGSNSSVTVTPDSIVVDALEQTKFTLSRASAEGGDMTVVVKCYTLKTPRLSTKYELALNIQDAEHRVLPVQGFAVDRPTLTFYNPERARQNQRVRVFNATDSQVSYEVWIGKKKAERKQSQPFILRSPDKGFISSKQCLPIHVFFQGSDYAEYFRDKLYISLNGRRDSIPLFGYSGGSDVRFELTENSCLKARNYGSRHGFVLLSGPDINSPSSLTARTVLGPNEEREYLAPYGSGTIIYTGDEIARSRMRRAQELCDMEKIDRIDEGGPFIESFEGENTALNGEDLIWTKESKHSLHYAGRLMDSNVRRFAIDPSGQSVVRLEEKSRTVEPGWSAFVDEHGYVLIENYDAKEDLYFTVAGAEPLSGIVPPLGDSKLTAFSETVIISARAKIQKICVENCRE